MNTGTTSKWRRAARKAAFWLWVPTILLIVTALMAEHWVILPVPESRDPVAAGLARLRTADGWLAAHVLYSECRCSQRILSHLIERGPLAGIAETVILVGADDGVGEKMRERGYGLDVVTPEELAEKYGFETAPLLAVADPAGAVRYLGGYTDRKQGPDIRDVAVIEALRAERETSELPLFGCAVSQSLQQVLDPLNLKYEKRGP